MKFNASAMATFYCGWLIVSLIRGLFKIDQFTYPLLLIGIIVAFIFGLIHDLIWKKK